MLYELSGKDRSAILFTVYDGSLNHEILFQTQSAILTEEFVKSQLT